MLELIYCYIVPIMSKAERQGHRQGHRQGTR